MAKKKRKKRKICRKNQQFRGNNRHHLLFQGRYWSKGYAKALREAFVFSIRIDLHNQLHNEVIHDVPRPSGDEIYRLWRIYDEQREYVDNLGIIHACEWLIANTRDEQFKSAIITQYKFFLDGGIGER